MKQILKYIACGIAAASVLASCNLDLYPINSIVYNEEVSPILTQTDLASFEIGIHPSFRGTQQSTYYYADDLMCDGFNAARSYGNNFGPLHRTDADYSASDQDIEAVWANYYGAIKNYNVAIVSVNSIEDPDLRGSELARYLKGEAFFYRAASYLYMARHFGKAYKAATADTDLSVPLTLTWGKEVEIVRATNAAVYKQIKADIDSAAFFLGQEFTTLPKAFYENRPRATRPTMDAVKALSARYFLEVGDFAHAAETAAELIDSGTYALSSDESEFYDEFSEDNGNEPIMQMVASQIEQPNGMGYFTSLFKSDGELYWTPYYLPSGKLVDAYEEDDLRLQCWFMNVGPDSYPLQLGGITVNDPEIKIFTKFLGNIAYEEASHDYPGGHNAVKPFRIGEQYLIAAEAYARNNDAANARKYLNELQEARGASATTADLENIKAEWFKETVGEGMRGLCLKRWGDGFSVRYAQPAAVVSNMIEAGKTNLADRSFTEKDMYLLTWPIPNYERKITPSLQQNEGYELSVN